ncbi:hypothetical protein U1Q18_042118 [Sarracenia purpurea var. burkii]
MQTGERVSNKGSPSPTQPTNSGGSIFTGWSGFGAAKKTESAAKIKGFQNFHRRRATKGSGFGRRSG